MKRIAAGLCVLVFAFSLASGAQHSSTAGGASLSLVRSDTDTQACIHCWWS